MSILIPRHPQHMVHAWAPSKCWVKLVKWTVTGRLNARPDPSPPCLLRVLDASCLFAELGPQLVGPFLRTVFCLPQSATFTSQARDKYFISIKMLVDHPLRACTLPLVLSAGVECESACVYVGARAHICSHVPMREPPRNTHTSTSRQAPPSMFLHR